jgi:hypothetical protein
MKTQDYRKCNIQKSKPLREINSAFIETDGRAVFWFSFEQIERKVSPCKSKADMSMISTQRGSRIDRIVLMMSATYSMQ